MLKEGDLVYFYFDEKRNYLLKINTQQKLHTDLGILEIKNAIGKNWGDFIETSLGKKFFLLKPTLFEMVMKIKRKTQIIYPKDLGLILMKCSIFPGARVIEVGTGSGALTTVLANFVRPNGKVYSYEKNEEFLENAKNNLKKNNLLEVVEFKHKEIISFFEEENVDFIMIDIGSPWELIPFAYQSLKGGHQICTICPTFDQLTKTVFCLEENNFINIEALEIFVRKILVRRGKTRPEQKIPSHTGWLVFGTKINK